MANDSQLPVLDFSETRAELFQARHLPGRFYKSPQIFEAEIERIFMKDWLCVGRVEQYPNSGDYRAMRIAETYLDEPVKFAAVDTLGRGIM